MSWPPEEASLQEEAVAYLAELLEGEAGEDGPAVHRRRGLPINHDRLDPHGSVVLYPVRETSSRGDHDGGSEDTLRFRAELRVRSPYGDVEDPPDVKLDRLFVWVVGNLLEDPTLGGRIRDLERTDRQWDDFAAQDYIYAGMGLDFEAQLITDESDPTVEG